MRQCCIADGFKKYKQNIQTSFLILMRDVLGCVLMLDTY